MPTNASLLDQLEIWFSLLQRKQLQPNRFSTTNALKTSLLELISYYNRTTKPIQWTYTSEELERKLGKLL